MKITKTICLRFTLLLLAMIAGATLLEKKFRRHDTSISISNSRDEVRFSAIFPKANSKAVHDYIRNQLNMNDLTDLSDVEIEEYQTPDRLMNFYIKSRKGYFKIVADKNKNSPGAFYKMREACEGLKKVLAEN